MKTETYTIEEGISTYPAPVLRKQADEIDEITPEIRDLAHKLAETMYRADGIGLAAPQIASSKRIVVVDVQDEFHILINPKVVSSSEETQVEEEGCLSLPGIRTEVERPLEITVKARNLEGETIELTRDGLASRVLHHEIDHLDGTLFIDRVGEATRSLLLKEYNKRDKEETEEPEVA